MIESINTDTLNELLPLIRSYQEFYQVADISDKRNQQFFAQFGAENPLGCQFAYRAAGELLGFATVYFTYSSALTDKVAVLNDLYTRSDQRGKGIGKALIEHCRRYAADNNAARLQWLTAADNAQAQILYDALDTRKSDWCLYTCTT